MQKKSKRTFNQDDVGWIIATEDSKESQPQNFRYFQRGNKTMEMEAIIKDLLKTTFLSLFQGRHFHHILGKGNERSHSLSLLLLILE